MDTPIISPWIFWLIDIGATIKSIAFVSTIFICIAFTITVAIYFATMDEYSKEEHRNAIKFMRATCLAMLVAGSVCIMVPSQQTCYQMLVASYVTPANINKAGETADVLLDKLCDKIVNMSDKMDRKKK